MAVDLNSDVGESYGVWTIGDDDAMLRVVSSANVACGFHGGDPTTLRAACAAASAHGVTIERGQVGGGRMGLAGKRLLEPLALAAEKLACSFGIHRRPLYG